MKEMKEQDRKDVPSNPQNSPQTGIVTGNPAGSPQEKNEKKDSPQEQKVSSTGSPQEQKMPPQGYPQGFHKRILSLKEGNISLRNHNVKKDNELSETNLKNLRAR